MSSECTEEDGPKKPFVKRTLSDIQRRKIEKLMKDPSKPVHIPERQAERDPNKAPDFVYNVMGSSAGAGSGEFHVYRQIRRKEMARQKILDGRRRVDELNAEFVAKLEKNERNAEERTEKKRAKRLKKKEKLRAKRVKGNFKKPSKERSSSSSSSDDEDTEKAKSTEKNVNPSEDTPKSVSGSGQSSQVKTESISDPGQSSHVKTESISDPGQSSKDEHDKDDSKNS